MNLLKFMEKKAKEKLVKIVVCEGWDERCVQASAEILKKKLAKMILLGNPKDIKKVADKLKVNIDDAEVVDYKNSELKGELVEKLIEKRQHKGMTKEKAEKLIEDENYFGCMYAYAGYADAVAGSAIGSTAELMRPVLQILRGKGLVSEVMITTDVKNKDRVIFMSDPSMNIEPDKEQLAQIALNSAEVVKMFGIEPKIAMLSFSTKGSGGDMPIIQLIKDAVEIVKKKDKKLIIDGELQVDAAVNKFSAGRKCPDSPIKGDANVLIFPNLTAGNILTHGLMRFSDMKFDFMIIQGLVKPVAILGRSVPAEIIKNNFVSLAMQVNA